MPREQFIKKVSIFELLKLLGQAKLKSILKERLTPEEFAALEMPTGEVDEEGHLTSLTGNNLNLTSAIWGQLEASIEDVIKTEMPEIEVDVSSEVNLSQAQAKLSKSQGRVQLELLHHEYFNALLGRIIYKLSKQDMDIVVAVLKRVVAFDKKQLAVSGKDFVSDSYRQKQDRSLRDISFLVDLEKSL